MFRGSVPGDMRAIIHETVNAWNVDDVWIGCSGNFTIERVLQSQNVRLHSNDVTLYSAALGWWAAGDDLNIVLNPESESVLDWVAPFMNDRDGTLAVVMLATQLFSSIGREDNPWHKRVVDGTKAQWQTLYDKTVNKIKGSGLAVDSFDCVDVVEWLAETVPADAPVVCFPPFFGGDYEVQFKSLTDHLLWPEPEYPELDDERKRELVGRIIDRPYWMVGLHVPQVNLSRFLRGVVQTTNRGVPIYVYASVGPTRIVRPEQKSEPVLAPRLSGKQLGERIAIAPLTGGQFVTLRSQYMNAGIVPGQPLLACAVTIDGHVAGAFAYGSPTAGFEPGCVYLLSDFPVAPTEHKHLAQLIVRAAISSEARQLVQRSVGQRSLRIRTTAFTNRHESMKYRAVFGKAAKRADADDGVHRFMLNYEGEFGELTLSEHYNVWRQQQ